MTAFDWLEKHWLLGPILILLVAGCLRPTTRIRVTNKFDGKKEPP